MQIARQLLSIDRWNYGRFSAVRKDRQLQNPIALDGKLQVRIVGDSDQITVLITILEQHVVLNVKLALEQASHHYDQLVVGHLFVVDRHFANIVRQLSLDDQLSGSHADMRKAAIHVGRGAVRHDAGRT